MRAGPQPTPFAPESLLSGILDHCARAIFAVEPDMKLLYQNAAGRKLALRADLLETQGGCIRFADSHLLTRITRHMRVATDASAHARPSNGLALHVSGRSCDAAHPSTYRLLLSQLGISDPSEAPPGVWLMFISRLSDEGRIQFKVLTQLYGLTNAESQLVASLFSGQSLEEAARTRAVSINTAKTHLRQVFQKCGVQSQASLLRLVALGPREL